MKSIIGLKYLIIVTLSLLLMGWTISGVAIYFRLFLFISLAIVGSYFWDVIALRGLAIERASRNKRISVGKVFDERIILSNRKSFNCLWVELEDLSALPQKNGSRLFTSLGGNQQRSFISRNWITRRGSFNLGPMKLTSGDLLGIFRNSRIVPSKGNLVVYPLIFNLERFPLPGGLLPGGSKIRLQTNDINPNVTGIREYAPGDPIKRIHWPSTARKMTYMVKLFEQDPKADIWIFIDGQKEAQFAIMDPVEQTTEKEFSLFRHWQVKLQKDSFEYAVSTAASLTRYLVRINLAVGLVSSGKNVTIVPAEHGERRLNKIYESLAFVEPDGNVPFNYIVQQQSRIIPMGGGIILITPKVTKGLLITIYDLLRRKLFPIVFTINNRSNTTMEDHEDVVGKLDAMKIPLYKLFINDDLGSQLAHISKERSSFFYPRQTPSIIDDRLTS